MRPADRPQRGGAALNAVLILVLIVVVGRFVVYLPLTWQALPGADFPAYHEGAKLFVEGRAERLYSEEFKLFQNMPVVTILLAPLGSLDYEDAWRLLWWLNLASMLVTLVLLLWAIRRFFPPLTGRDTLLAVAIYFLFAPVMLRSLVLGQTTPLITLLLAGCYVLLRLTRPLGAGALLGLIGLVKIPPLLLIAFMALRRRLRLVGAAVAVIVVGLAFSLAVFGIDLNLQYVDRVIVGNANKVLAAHNNQSLVASLMRIMTERSLTDWNLEPPPGSVAVLSWIGNLAILGLVAWRGRGLWWPRAEPDDTSGRGAALEVELGLVIAAMLLLFPISWIHYFEFLVVPLTVLPFWWRRAGLRFPPASLAVLVTGSVLAAGTVVRASPYYARFDSEMWFRLLQCSRTLGALLLLWGLGWALAEHRRVSSRGPAA